MFLVLSVICIVLLLLLFKSRNRNYWKKRGIMQLDAHTWHFLLGKSSLSEVYKNIYDNHDSQDYIGTFIGIKPVLVLRNLKDVQAVLQSDFKSFYGRGYETNPKDVLANNLLLVDDYDRWRLLRQKLTTIFTGSKIKNHYNALGRCAADFVEYIKANQHAKDNPSEALHTYTFSSISASIFGIDSQSGCTMENPILDIGWKYTESHLTFNIKFATSFFFPKLFNILNLKLFGERKIFIIEVIKKVLSYRPLKEKKQDFIGMCLESHNKDVPNSVSSNNYDLRISYEMLAAQVLSFLIAGVDTSASSMNFILLELSNKPEILKRLHDEIDKIFDGCNEKLSFDEITKMTYMDMIINESMRKYPPIGLMQRMCMKDTVLPGGNRKIDKDTIVIVPLYAIHRDKRYFSQPDDFNPERFTPENLLKIHKCSFLPFGEGNRMCLGARFAQVQIKVGLAWLLRRFTLKGYNYRSEYFDPSFFAIRDSKARYDLVPRNIPGQV